MNLLIINSTGEVAVSTEKTITLNEDSTKSFVDGRMVCNDPEGLTVVSDVVVKDVAPSDLSEIETAEFDSQSYDEGTNTLTRTYMKSWSGVEKSVDVINTKLENLVNSINNTTVSYGGITVSGSEESLGLLKDVLDYATLLELTEGITMYDVEGTEHTVDLVTLKELIKLVAGGIAAYKTLKFKVDKSFENASTQEDFEAILTLFEQ